MHEYSILSRSDNGLHKLLNGAGGGGGGGVKGNRFGDSYYRLNCSKHHYLKNIIGQEFIKSSFT